MAEGPFPILNAFISAKLQKYADKEIFYLPMTTTSLNSAFSLEHTKFSLDIVTQCDKSLIWKISSLIHQNEWTGNAQKNSRKKLHNFLIFKKGFLNFRKFKFFTRFCNGNNWCNVSDEQPLFSIVLHIYHW